MDDVENLKTAIEDLQSRLREESQAREELERRCHILEKLAYRDPTTGLKTEAYMKARIREELDRATRYPASASLITLGIPPSKSPSVLDLGLRLGEELRSTDQVFSLNGQGLAILLVETPGEGAQIVLDRLAADLDHFAEGYGATVTSFPVDANVADDFLDLAMSRHQEILKKVSANGHDHASPCLS